MNHISPRKNESVQATPGGHVPQECEYEVITAYTSLQVCLGVQNSWCMNRTQITSETKQAAHEAHHSDAVLQ